MGKPKQGYKNYKEIINYLIVGGLTEVITLAVYYACVSTFLNPESAVQLQIANLLSWIVAVLFAYVSNRQFVFESKCSHIIREASSFFASRIGTLLLSMVLMFLTVTFMHLNDRILKLIVELIVVIANYFASKLFVFNKKINLTL